MKRRAVALYGPNSKLVWRGEAETWDETLHPDLDPSLPVMGTWAIRLPVPLEPVPDFPFVRLPKEEDADA
jgi:hypothetical protein